MTAIERARDFLSVIAGFTEQPAENYTPSQDRPVRLATVDPAYTGVGNARVTFDGESLLGVRPYVPLAPVRASERVVMLPVGRGYVILGAIGASATSDGIAGAKLAARNRNRVINGDFAVNERAAASGTSLAALAYFLDRWQGVEATNAITWSGDQYAGRVVTVPASKTMRTTLERADVEAGNFVLSWAGTAQARIYKAGGSAPSLASAPVAFTSDGSDDVRIEFGPGTVSQVQLELGTVPTSFERIHYSEKLALCQRYYWRNTIPDAAGYYFSGLWATTSLADVIVPIGMRVTPTCTFSNLGADSSSAGGTVSSVFGVTMASRSVYVRLNTGATGVLNGGVFFRRITAGSTGWLALSAEF